MINLDNASTTKPLNEVINAIAIALQEDYLNMGAKYKQAKLIEKKVNFIRQNILNILGANQGDLIFTPSATCANNLVFNSLNPKSCKKILVSAGEHASVYECAKQMQLKNVLVDYIALQEDGRINFEDFKKKMTPDVALVAVLHVSNETGAINDISEISSFAKQINHNCLIFSDGVQAFGKIDVNIENLGIDFYTISAHKIHGPKGIGALYAKDITKLKTLIYGGGQEYNLISGTENTAYINGFYTAIKLKIAKLKDDYNKVKCDKQNLISALINQNIEFEINGNVENSSPYILNISIKGIRGEVLLHALAEKDILIATGSACSSKKRGNRTLENMGKKAQEIDSAIRISFSAHEEYDMNFIAQQFKEIIDTIYA